MTKIHTQRQIVLAQIAQAARAAERSAAEITLLTVTKTHPPAVLRAAFEAGLKCFGENYLQEALDKILALCDLDIEWHFIGPVQSNKTQPVAQHFAWVHSIDRLKIAQRLSTQRPANLPPLNVCLQLNISGESTKSGVSLSELSALAHAVARLPNLKLRGLMAMPEPTIDSTLLAQRFASVREARDVLNTEGLALDTLSMGMSADLAIAIAQGSTLVRVGTALLGQR